VDFRIVKADSGKIGGNRSEEFHVLAGSGEDLLAVSSDGEYAANVEAADALPPTDPMPAPGADMPLGATAGDRTTADGRERVGVTAARCMNTLIVAGADGGPVALLLRGDHELNEVKAAKHPRLADNRTLIAEVMIRQRTGCF